MGKDHRQYVSARPAMDELNEILVKLDTAIVNAVLEQHEQVLPALRKAYLSLQRAYNYYDDIWLRRPPKGN